MKAMPIIVCLIASLFGFSAQAQEIPGGIVYSNGKSAIYLDYQSGQTRSLIADLPGLTIKGPLAASEDGFVLTWQQENKFLARRLPDGEPYPIMPRQFDKTAGAWIDFPINLLSVVDGRISPVPGNVRNLTLSPEGDRLSFESTERNKAWSLVEPGDLRVRADNYNSNPKYTAKVGDFNATTVLQTGSGWCWRYGNTACYPPRFPIRTSYESIGADRNWKVVEGPLLQYLTTPAICPGLTVTVQDAQTRFSKERNAHLLAWQKSSSWQATNQLFAVIYRATNGWGPIEIHNAQYTGLTSSPEHPFFAKPGVWEIPVSLTSCDGLAWKPDGSLTYLSGGKVFSFDANRILEGIRNSGLATDRRVFEKGHVANCTVPARNILDIRGTLVAEGINGDRLHWVTNDTFLFRAREGSLRNICSWRQGRIERLCSAPEEFSYCDQPPSGASIATPGISSGRSRVIEAIQGCAVTGGKNAEFSVGSIRTRWTSGDTESLRIWTGKLDDQNALEFAFPTEAKIEDIRNPSLYSYRNGSTPSALHVSLNQIVILRIGSRYAAIKPLTVEPKAGWTGTPPPPYEWMTCEWKYWSQSARIDANTKNGNGIANAALTPTLGKETATGRQITVGDIKTAWRRTTWGRNSPTKQGVVGIEFDINSLPGGGNTEFTSIPSNRTLESIIDPSGYRYTKYETLASHTIQAGWIIILKVGDRYAAIKPIELKQQGTTEVLVYEWKYWPGTPLEAPVSNLAKADSPTLK